MSKRVDNHAVLYEEFITSKKYADDTHRKLLRTEIENLRENMDDKIRQYVNLQKLRSFNVEIEKLQEEIKKYQILVNQIETGYMVKQNF